MNKPKSPMKKASYMLMRALLVLILIIGAMSQNVNAQNPTVHRDWTFLGESNNHIDVTYQIATCSVMSGPQLMLSILNENPVAVTASFSVTLTQGSNTQSIPVSVNCAAAELKKGNCADNNALRMALPQGFSQSDVNVSITFN